MSGIIIYLLKAALTVMMVWIVYSVIFSRLTFFRFNRFFLLGGLVFSFLVPLIPLSSPGIEVVVPAFDEGFFTGVPDQPASQAVSGSQGQPAFWLDAAFYLWFLLALLYLLRSAIQLSRLKKMSLRGQVLHRGRLRLVILGELPSAFTFFRSVYIDRYTYRNRLMPVIRHEWVHAREGHSLDLLFMETACALLWFNPFVFLLRKAVRENLEYLADERSSRDTPSLIGYLEVLQGELLRSHSLAFASYFNRSTLKKRIMMLTNKRSDRRLRWSYLLVLPLLALVLMAFHKSASGLPLSGEPSGKSLPVLQTQGVDKGLPHVFPLGSEYRNAITWNYGIKAKNPVTGVETEHGGVDIKAPEGTPVYATADGEVSKVTENDDWGKLLVIKHKDGYMTWYAHLSDISVREGAAVKAGEKVASVGSTGKSTGPHLHYEVRLKGERVDPNRYY